MASFKLNPEFKRKLQEISKPKTISLPELMPPEFMRTHTKFQDIQEMFDKSDFADVQEEEVIEILKSEAWNDYVRTHTRFSSWEEMLKAAGAANIKQRWNL